MGSLHPSGLPPFRVTRISGTHPFWPPPFGSPLFSGFWPPSFGAPTPLAPITLALFFSPRIFVQSHVFFCPVSHFLNFVPIYFVCPVCHLSYCPACFFFVPFGFFLSPMHFLFCPNSSSLLLSRSLFLSHGVFFVPGTAVCSTQGRVLNGQPDPGGKNGKKVVRKNGKKAGKRQTPFFECVIVIVVVMSTRPSVSVHQTTRTVARLVTRVPDPLRSG